MRHKAYETRNLQLAPTGDGEDQETKYTQVSMTQFITVLNRTTIKKISPPSPPNIIFDYHPCSLITVVRGANPTPPPSLFRIAPE